MSRFDLFLGVRVPMCVCVCIVCKQLRRQMKKRKKEDLSLFTKVFLYQNTAGFIR